MTQSLQTLLQIICVMQMLQILCLCVHTFIHSLDMIFLKFDLVYIYERVGYLHVCVKRPMDVQPKELWRNVSEYFIHKGDFFHKGQVLPLLLHNLSNANICIAL